MDVVISGSSGFVGSALARSLAADGHRVVRLVRPSTGEQAGDTVRWDPDAGTIDAAGLEGVGAVVHLAGAGIGDQRWTPERRRVILESRTESTSLLASAVAGLRRQPAVFVSASAIGYYGNRGDEILTEDSAPGDDFFSDVCVQWEDAARPAAEAGLRVVWIRMGVVLDPGGGLLARVALPFKLGLGGRVGSGRQYRSWITRPDLVSAIRAVVDDSSYGGPVNLTAPAPVTDAEFAATLGKVLHRPAVLPAPLPALRLWYGSELVQRLLLDGQRVVPAKLQAAGFDFAHPDLETGLRAVLHKR